MKNGQKHPFSLKLLCSIPLNHYFFINYFPFLAIESLIYFYVTTDNTIVKYQDNSYIEVGGGQGKYKELNVKDFCGSLQGLVML